MSVQLINNTPDDTAPPQQPQRQPAFGQQFQQPQQQSFQQPQQPMRRPAFRQRRMPQQDFGGMGYGGGYGGGYGRGYGGGYGGGQFRQPAPPPPMPQQQFRQPAPPPPPPQQFRQPAPPSMPQYMYDQAEGMYPMQRGQRAAPMQEMAATPFAPSAQTSVPPREILHVQAQERLGAAPVIAQLPEGQDQVQERIPGAPVNARENALSEALLGVQTLLNPMQPAAYGAQRPTGLSAGGGLQYDLRARQQQSQQQSRQQSQQQMFDQQRMLQLQQQMPQQQMQQYAAYGTPYAGLLSAQQNTNFGGGAGMFGTNNAALLSALLRIIGAR